MRILVTEPLEKTGMEILQRNAQVDVVINPSSEELQGLIGSYDALVVRSRTQVNRALIEHAENIKVVGRAGTGVDNIDVDAATERGIIVVNAPSGNSNAVAEETIAMILIQARRLYQAIATTKAGKWEKSSLQGFEVKGKMLGLIGLGRVGSLVASKAKGLEMRVIAFDPYTSPERAASSGIELLGFNEVLAQADFITVHTPLTAETKGLINLNALRRMKPSAFIINCARGGIINESDLKIALSTNVIAGAALDVFEVEPVRDTELVALPNLLPTPHLGASTIEAQESVSLDVAQAVIDALEGRMPSSPVNLPYLPPNEAAFLAPYIDLAERLGSFFIQWRGEMGSRIELTYDGELSTRDVRGLTSAFLAGLLGAVSDAPINRVNATMYARQRGLIVSEVKAGNSKLHHTMITAHFPDCGAANISGTIIQGEPHLVILDSYRLDTVLQGSMLVDLHHDRPGFVGAIGQLLGQANVNISFAQLGRFSQGGQSIMILGLDDELNHTLLEDVRQLPGMERARMVKLPALNESLAYNWDEE
ncbi:MAG: phosphoglycerate dehydrogenase [Chloroflexi bacterium]|nr:phosphoglycerate dehydrogenase [Chloroflexota bacterium]